MEKEIRNVLAGVGTGVIVQDRMRLGRGLLTSDQGKSHSPRKRERIMTSLVNQRNIFIDAYKYNTEQNSSIGSRGKLKKCYSRNIFCTLIESFKLT